MGDFAGGEAIREDLERALNQRAVVLRPTGSSMSPFIRDGDMVRLEKRALRRGSIALVDQHGDLWLHRLVANRDGRWLVRGDARTRPQEWIESEDILAVVTARRRADAVHWQSVSSPTARATGMAWSTVSRAFRGLLVRGPAQVANADEAAELDPGAPLGTPGLDVELETTGTAQE